MNIKALILGLAITVFSVVFSRIAHAKQVTVSIDANIIATQCYSSTWQRKDLLALAQRDFMIEDKEQRDALALQLLNCLASADGKVRDGVAYSGLTKWLRADMFSHAQYQSMFSLLIAHFNESTHDVNDVYQPFVALMLAELARVDRKSPYLSVQQRELLVSKSTAFMHQTNDYRGFETGIGWRHRIAHNADLFLQLSLNPAITKEQLTRMLNAIGQQVLAGDNHFYIYGEPKRLAMPLLYIFLREQHNEQDWQAWLAKYITPAPLKKWQMAYSSQQGLSRLHNAQAFLNTVHTLIADSENKTLVLLKPALVKTLKTVR